MSVQIAPSILSADFAALGEAIAAVERGGADLIHVDVMDGHFVPEHHDRTAGRASRSSASRTVPLDVHLMITDPDRYIDAFAEAGAAMISVHVEVLPHLHRTVHAIKALGVKAGVVLNPATPVVALEEIAGDVDFVLVMSVNPGFGGQTFIPRSESKVREVRALLDRAGNAAAPIEIDGGIDLTNVAARRRGRRADPRRRLRRSSTRPIPSAPRATSRRGRRARSQRAPPPGERRRSRRQPRARALRRNRSDGRRLLRELLRLVRGRPHRSAARVRAGAIARWKPKASRCR